MTNKNNFIRFDYRHITIWLTTFFSVLSFAQRPDHVNNALLKYFPPIVNQVGNSCSPTNRFYYILTNELNSYHDKDGSLLENQIPSHFFYLQNAYQDRIATHLGAPNAADYGGNTYSRFFGLQDIDWPDYGWMQGYDKWYRAMFNRLDSRNQITTEKAKDWLWNHCGDTDFHGGGLLAVSIVSGYKTDKIPITESNNAIGVSGMKYISGWEGGQAHTNTIVGYDDRIEFDLDGNGIAGEKEKDEVGAWIVANTWGDEWENKGFVYCPYFRFTSGERCFIKKEAKPKRVMKIKMDYSKRSMICLSATSTTDTTSTIATDSMTFEHFCYRGDGTGQTLKNPPLPPAVPMLGKWNGKMNYEPMEFGYNLDELIDEKYDVTKPIKYWFNVHTLEKVAEPGTGHIQKVSIMDYSTDEEGIEFPSVIDTIVDINGSGTWFRVAVVVRGEDLKTPENVNVNKNELRWTAPQSSLVIKGYNIYADGKIIATLSPEQTSYLITNDKVSHFAVSALYELNEKEIESQKSNSVAKSVIDIPATNHVLAIQNSSISISNLNTQKSNEATMEFWLKPYALGKSTQCVGYNDINQLFAAHNKKGGIEAGWGLVDNIITENYMLSVDKWTHIAVVFKKDTLRLYIDGELYDEEISFDNHSGFPAIVDLQLGLIENDNLMNGEIDEFRLWNRARNSEEIKNDMRSEIVAPSFHKDLVAYLKMETFNDNGVLKIRDYAKGNHAIVDDWNLVEQKEDNSLFDGSAQLNVAINGLKEGEVVKVGENVTPDICLSANVSSVEWTTSDSKEPVIDIINPSLSFTTAGKQTLNLKIKDIDGNEKVVSQTFNVSPMDKPLVDFTMSETSKATGEKFSFVNKSIAINATYEWSMKGARCESFKGVNASAIYDSPGTYEVTLTATNDAGSSSVTKEIRVVKSAPKVEFEVKPYNILLGEKTYLVDKTRYEPTQWKWDIEKKGRHYVIEGQNSSYQPVAPGYYTISQTATNDIGTSRLSIDNALIVSNADAKTSLRFDGRGSRIEISKSPVTERKTMFTLDFWMNPDKYDGAFAFSSADDVFKTCTNNDGSVSVNMATKIVNSGANYVLTGSWHHYAIVYKSGKLTFYRDGKVFSAPSTLLSLYVKDWVAPFSICTPNELFSGYYDELRFWDKNLSKEKIAEYANTPITDIDKAMSEDKLLLYYDFNQNTGNVIDRTGNGYTGTRVNFGPDGDAWTNSIGVFTLDLDIDEESSDVTSRYLTNYKAPFISNGNTVNRTNSSRFLALEQGTEKSGWKLENQVNVNNILGGVHIDTDHKSYFTVESGWSSFPSTIINHKAYQTITLPAGFYAFRVKEGDGIEGRNYIVATLGDSLNSTSNLDDAIAYSALDTYYLDFFLEEESTISLGILYNMEGQLHTSLSAFSLEHTDYAYFKADGLVDSYQAVKAGKQNKFEAVNGGVKMICENNENVRIFTIDGICIFNDIVHGVHIVPLPEGNYIVNGIKISITPKGKALY